VKHVGISIDFDATGAWHVEARADDGRTRLYEGAKPHPTPSDVIDVVRLVLGGLLPEPTPEPWEGGPSVR